MLRHYKHLLYYQSIILVYIRAISALTSCAARLPIVLISRTDWIMMLFIFKYKEFYLARLVREQCLCLLQAVYQIDESTETGTCAAAIMDNERSLVANLAAANNYKVWPLSMQLRLALTEESIQWQARYSNSPSFNEGCLSSWVLHS